MAVASDGGGWTESSGGGIRGFFSRLFGGGGGHGGGFGGGGGSHGWIEEVEYGQQTKSELPPIVKEHTHHSYIKIPHVKVQTSHSGEQKRVKVIHNHHKTEKLIHENHHHKHIINQHHVHKVHLHNQHNQVNHVHENIVHQEHVHVPIEIKHEQDEHKETAEKQVKTTVAETHKSVYSTDVQSKQAPPIYKKEWTFAGWLNAWAGK